MHSRVVFGLCTIAIFLFMVSSSVTVAEEYHHPRTKLNAPWLSAPHFQMLTKRGRFVFRDTHNDHFHELNDIDDGSLHPDKRNWRL
jgi:hypothetical protein